VVTEAVRAKPSWSALAARAASLGKALVHRLGVLKDIEGRGVSAVSGEQQHRHHTGLLGQQGGHPGPGQGSCPPGHPLRKPQRRAQPDAGSPDRQQQRHRHHRHPDGGTPRQPRLGRAGQGERVVAGAADGGGEGQVGGDHGQARQQWGQCRGDEAVMGLQDAGQHHPDPVQHDLRSEDEQHPRGQGLRPGTGVLGHQQPGQRPGSQRDEHRHRGQHQHRPGQQRRGDPVGDLARRVIALPGAGQRTGQQWDHRTRQRTTGHHLEQHVGYLVGGRVGVAHALG
jgi:hypothetical protein